MTKAKNQTKKAAPKKRKNSRAKGKTYERLVAKELGGWWGEPFRSTPGSGALHWEQDSRVAGDIVAPVDSKFPFTVECKKREGWYFDGLINETGEIPSWWQQALEDAARVDREPLLVFSKNRAPSYVMMHWETFERLGCTANIHFKTWLHTSPDKRYIVGIGRLDSMLELSPDAVLKAF